MKLLLHTCCAPCLIYPAEVLKDKGLEVTGFFYNPNIHPFTEYKNRKEALDNFTKDYFTEIIYPEYNPQEFFQAVNQKETNPGRCSLCWELRLKKTAQAALEWDFAYFSTTLLVSPYQDQERLREIGNAISSETGLSFYWEDFRPGFRQAHNQAHAQGIYCQKYCGCIYSEIERSKVKSQKSLPVRQAGKVKS